MPLHILNNFHAWFPTQAPLWKGPSLRAILAIVSDIFISYSHKDTDFARDLVKPLQAGLISLGAVALMAVLLADGTYGVVDSTHVLINAAVWARL
jgi:hypothetical protein